MVVRRRAAGKQRVHYHRLDHRAPSIKDVEALEEGRFDVLRWNRHDPGSGCDLGINRCPVGEDCPHLDPGAWKHAEGDRQAFPAYDNTTNARRTQRIRVRVASAEGNPLSIELPLEIDASSSIGSVADKSPDDALGIRTDTDCLYGGKIDVDPLITWLCR